MQSLYSFARFFRQGIGGGVYDPNGIAPTIISNHGEVIRVLIYGGKDNTGDEPITLCEI